MDIQSILNAKGSNVISVAPSATLVEAAKLLHDNRIGVVLVMENENHIVGILSERDIVRAVAEQGAETLKSPVERFMTTDVKVCSPDSTLDTIISGITKLRIRHLPVVEEGKLLSMVSIGDILKHRILQLQAGEERFSHLFRKGRIGPLKAFE